MTPEETAAHRAHRADCCPWCEALAQSAIDRAIADIDFRLAHLHAGGGYTVPRRKAAEAWARAHLNGVRAVLMSGRDDG